MLVRFCSHSSFLRTSSSARVKSFGEIALPYLVPGQISIYFDVDSPFVDVFH